MLRSLRIERRFLHWFMLTGAVCLLFYQPLIDLARLALNNSSFSHIGLIPLIFLYLVFQRREALERTDGQGASSAVVLGLLSLAVVAAALGLGGELNRTDQLAVYVAGFVVAVWAVFVWRFGRDGVNQALFPLLFLLFMVPFPTYLLDQVVAALLWGSTIVTEQLFRLTGIPFFQDGYTFRLPGLAIEIAKECSGIRSTMALVITGLLAGQMMLRTWWGRSTLILLLFPLAVFKNGLRIVTLSLLTIHVDRGFIEGDLHSRGGFVFFVITLCVMGVILWGIQKLEGRRAE